MTELEFRNKVTWFSFALSLLVIWVHSYNAELFLGYQAATGMVYVLEHRIGEWFGQIAVPGFFVISGYQFYRDFDWGKLKSKWQRRVKSLLVPYIVWNFLYYLSYVTASRIPAVRDVVGKGVVEFSLASAVDAVIGHTYNNVFWYLYQLLWLVVLAPVLYPLLKRMWSGLLLLAFFWVLVRLDISGLPVNPDALIYYSSGAMAALHFRKAVEGAESRKRCVFGLFCLGAATCIYYIGLWQAHIPSFVLCRLCAVTGFWLVIPGKRLPEAKDFMKHNFFLYAVHFAFVRLINKAAAMLTASAVPEWYGPFGLFLVMPVLVLLISTLIGKFLRRYLPGLWKLLTGGR